MTEIKTKGETMKTCAIEIDAKDFNYIKTRKVLNTLFDLCGTPCNIDIKSTFDKSSIVCRLNVDEVNYKNLPDEIPDENGKMIKKPASLNCNDGGMTEIMAVLMKLKPFFADNANYFGMYEPNIKMLNHLLENVNTKK